MSNDLPRRRLGRTDLMVFPLNLGGNVFGWTADRAQSFAVLDAYREAGGNFVDTADMYSHWVKGHRGGESEEVIGAWLRERSCRGEMIIATKVGMGGPDTAGAGLSAKQIRQGCEGSLRRLGVERIDLYYAHLDDPKTPLEETLGALDRLVRQGKVRHLGSSNYEAGRLEEALEVSLRSGLTAFAVHQPEYNLVRRKVLEGPLAEVCLAHSLGVCTYFALASGFLTGKYGNGQPKGARAGGVEKYVADPAAQAVLSAAREVARRRGATVSQVALAWQLARPEVTTPISSATSPEQLRELLGAVSLTLEAGDLAALEGAGGAV